MKHQRLEVSWKIFVTWKTGFVKDKGIRVYIMKVNRFHVLDGYSEGTDSLRARNFHSEYATNVMAMHPTVEGQIRDRGRRNLAG